LSRKVVRIVQLYLPFNRRGHIITVEKNRNVGFRIHVPEFAPSGVVVAPFVSSDTGMKASQGVGIAISPVTSRQSG